MSIRSQIYSAYNVVTADFKTVKTKFSKLGIEDDVIDSYLQQFKDLNSKNKIKEASKKNIDFWGKKTWKEFQEFVDSLSKEKTKSAERKSLKMEGAKLVAQNEDWKVFKIEDKKACDLYGSGTKWCITNPDAKQWESYSDKNNFYFFISKKLDASNPHYKIAMSVSSEGKKEYWDAEDSKLSSLPSALKLPKFEIEKATESIFIEGKKYDLHNLPSDLKVSGNLYLSDTNITELPSGLQVGGSLYLYYSSIKKLPSGLIVGGDLDLRDTKITELPSGLQVGGSLYLYYSSIKKLPSGLIVGGDLDLRDTKITELPSGLQVGGNLYLNGTQITELPSDLKVVGNLYLYADIKVPSGIQVGGRIIRR